MLRSVCELVASGLISFDGAIFSYTEFFPKILIWLNGISSPKIEVAKAKEDFSCLIGLVCEMVW